MAGIRLKFSINDQAIQRALKKLERAGGQMEPAFRDIGEALLNSTRERFATQQAPDGSPWAPLSPKTRRRKRRNKNKILTLEGDLKDLLRYQASDDQVELGSDRIYAAPQQLGDIKRNIPARPFLGLSNDDQTEVLEIIQDHLNRALSS